MQNSRTSAESSAQKKQKVADTKLFEVKRNFDVSVEQLFKAFTNAEVIKIWWWPQDLYADKIELDFREGGTYFFNMKGYDQGGGGMTGQFEEIIPNQKIVMTDYFADEKGHRITAQQANMPGDWPDVIYITFEFTSIDPFHSQVKLSQTGIPNDQQEDCILGWNQSFDKLENYLGRRVN